MKNLYLVSILLFFWGCNQESVNNKIILKFDNLEVSDYEYKKNIDGIISQSQESINKKDVLRYLNGYYFVSDAIGKGYDTISDIKKQVFYTSQLMMVQKYGYLWKETASINIDKFKKLNNQKIEKRKKIYYFDYILVTDYAKFKSFFNTNDSIIKKEDYSILKKSCNKYDFLETGYSSQQWPFLAFNGYMDYIFNMKVGDISKILKIENFYYILYLEHIETIDIDETEKKKLETELQLYKEVEIDKKKENEIKQKGDLKIYEDNIDSFLIYLIDSSFYEIDNQKIIMEYSINGVFRKINFKDFKEYLTFTPFNAKIDSRDKIREFISQFYWDDFLSEEAKTLGLYSANQFLLDQRNYRNKLLIQKYLEREVWQKICVDSNEVISYFSNNPSSFTKPKSFTGDIYLFANYSDALGCVPLFEKLSNTDNVNLLPEKTAIPNLLDIIQNYSIDNVKSWLPTELLKEIYKTPINGVCYKPIPLKGKYGIFFKKENVGDVKESISESFEKIYLKLKYEKSIMKEEELLNELKQKYKIKLNNTGYDL